PGHPTSALTLNDNQFSAIVPDSAGNVGSEVALRHRRERAISSIGQPKATRDVQSRLFPPDRSGRQIGRAWRVRQDIEENGASVIPNLLGLGGRDHTRALERGRRRSTIVLSSIPVRFGCVLTEHG